MSAAAPPATRGVIVSLLAWIVPVDILPPWMVVWPSVDKSLPITNPPAVITPGTSILSADNWPATILFAFNVAVIFALSMVASPIWAFVIVPFWIKAASK